MPNCGNASIASAATKSTASHVNFGLAAMHVSLNIFQFFVLPMFLLPQNAWWAAAAVPIALLNNPFWALIHETIHDLFHPSLVVNSAAGRLLAIFFGAPFHVLRLTHLSHHKFNRSPLEKGTEIYDPAKVSRLHAGIGYFCYIFCGLYLLEIFSTVLFLLPGRLFRKLRRRVADGGNLQQRWLARKFMDDNLVEEVRVDSVLIWLLLAVSAFCYRRHWPVLAGILTARIFLISFMDNIYHYRTPLHATVSGHNLRLPPSVSTLLLHFNLHRVHHRHPNVPWLGLPEVFAEEAEKFDRPFLCAAVDQLRGPLPMTAVAPAPPVIARPKSPQTFAASEDMAHS